MEYPGGELMQQEDPRKTAPNGKDGTSNPFDVEGEENERRSGEYSFVYHEIARITTVRKSIPARPAEHTGKGDKPNKNR